MTATALTTATLALVIEDALAKPSENSQLLWYRGLALLGALLLAAFAVGWRSQIRRTAGTLFYVHLLDEGMRDLRAVSLKAAAAHRMSAQSISRWLDLDRRMIHGVVDLHQSCHEIGTALESAINTDSDDTGYTVAPNLFWPASFVVGAYLPVSRDLRLLELSPNGEREFALEPGESGQVDVATHAIEAAGGNRIGVWLAFTLMAEEFSVGDFDQFGVETVHIITAGGSIPNRAKPPDYKGKELAEIGRAITQELVRIKKYVGDRELVVIAMIPKTVALAIGWQLTHDRCRFFRDTHLMHYDDVLKVYVPMRVSPSQPSIPPQRD